MRTPRILVIIPAFNEATVVGAVIRDVRAKVGRNTDILVVDDGSGDETATKARRAGASVLRHSINRGLGGALGTGLYWAKIHDYKVAVTFDADGQHDPKDLVQVIQPILRGNSDVVIGSRVLSGWAEIPLDRKVMIKSSNLLTRWLFGIRTTDSLSGFRAFNRTAIERIQLRTNRMEVSNEFFSEIQRNKLRLSEEPIRVIYTSYSRSKGQQNMNAIDVATKLLLRLFR